jgi:hypothetical protein
MHTLKIVGAGLLLLGVCLLLGWWLSGASGASRGALYFIPLWLLAAALNLYIGVSRAGYSVSDEAPIFLVVFLIPAAIAAFIHYRLLAP